MTPLRQRMIDAMLLRGFAPRTQQAYCAAVVALAKHFRRSPETLSAEQLQSYLLYLITEKKLAYASVNQAACAFRFIFGTVLRWPEVRFDIPMAKVPKRLPQILSREEVTRLIDAGATLRGRTLLATAYAAGLRVSEVCALQLTDIESAPDRMCLKVRQGKGSQPLGQRADRSVDGAAHLLRRPRRCRHPPRRRHPHLAPRFRHSPARGRRGPADHSATPGPWPHRNDHALSASGAQPAHRHHVPSGTARPAATLSATDRAAGRPSRGPGRGVAPSRPGLSRGSSLVGCQGEGLARYRRVPNRRPGRSCANLRRLRQHAPRLSLLPQPSLPALPDARQGSLAHRAPARGVAGAVLPPGVHLAP